MCGRFLNKLPAAEIARSFRTSNPLTNYPARYNIAPTQPVLTVRFNPEPRERSLDALRWGLVPHWAKDLSFNSRCINARAETVYATPAFRDAFKSRASRRVFYEWKKTGTTVGVSFRQLDTQLSLTIDQLLDLWVLTVR